MPCSTYRLPSALLLAAAVGALSGCGLSSGPDEAARAFVVVEAEGPLAPPSTRLVVYALAGTCPDTLSGPGLGARITDSAGDPAAIRRLNFATRTVYRQEVASEPLPVRLAVEGALGPSPDGLDRVTYGCLAATASEIPETGPPGPERLLTSRSATLETRYGSDGPYDEVDLGRVRLGP